MILGIGLAVSAVSPVSAEVSSAESIADSVSDAVAVVSSDVNVPLQVVASSGGFEASPGTTVIDIPSKADGEVRISSIPGAPAEYAGLSIGLPEELAANSDAESAVDGTITYEGESDAHSVVQALENGVRLSTVLDSSDAPSEFTYSLPSDVRAVINGDGSATLQSELSNTGEDGVTYSATVVIGSIEAPWAVDANGVSLPTHYESIDGALIQVINHSSDVAYPVVADPTFWWGWNIYVSNSTVGKITSLLIAGASATVVAANVVRFIPGINVYVGSALTLAGSLIAFGAAMLNVCNWNKRGVYLGSTWVTGFMLPGLLHMRWGYFCVPN